MGKRKRNADTVCAKVLKLSGKTITRVLVLKLSAKMKCPGGTARSADYNTKTLACQGFFKIKKRNICCFLLFPTAITTTVPFFAFASLSARECVRGRHIEG